MHTIWDFYCIFSGRLKLFNIARLLNGSMKPFNAPMGIVQPFKINFCYTLKLIEFNTANPVMKANLQISVSECTPRSDEIIRLLSTPNIKFSFLLRMNFKFSRFEYQLSPVTHAGITPHDITSINISRK